jgi:hypothetical protein
MHPKAAFRKGEVFCDECGKELDANGLFPEENCTVNIPKTV